MNSPSNNTSIITPASRIYVAGHRGLVGSAIVRRLRSEGYHNIVTRTHGELDLLDQRAVHEFMHTHTPDYIFLAAAKVGGIHANSTFPADFIYQNLAIESNIIHAAYASGVNRLMFLGSSCIYPRDCPQPMKESYLLTGPLEKTNEPYAIAKIAGIKLCESYNRQHGTRYISVMPTNLYGQNDNFDLKNSHVLPALLRKMHEAKINNERTVTIWGTGNPRREFLHVDDMADACVFLMGQEHAGEIYNIGTGQDITIHDLAGLIKEIVDHDCELIFDATMPDGAPRKLLDVSRLSNCGWGASISLKEGITSTYQWYLNQ